jgi:uncharacterized membrane protein
MNPTPRTVDDYLAELRRSLAGADPALVQDALYDAEEHLRAECAVNTDKTEAQVLEMILSTYGAPEEVAAAYRDTEMKDAAALRRQPSRAHTSSIGRIFGVYSDPRAYTGILYMLLSLATGILYFTVTIVGLSVSAGLAILIIGIPFFLAFVGISRALSLMECRFVEAMSGVRMPRRPPHPGAPRGFWVRVRSMLADTRTWTTLAYDVLMLPIGIINFTVAVTFISVGVSLTVAPVIEIVCKLGGIDSGSILNWVGPPIPTDFFRSLPWLAFPLGLVASMVIGISIVTATLYLARFIVRAHARIAKSLLVLP